SYVFLQHQIPVQARDIFLFSLTFAINNDQQSLF
ncbi:MAG: hypothetical protein ACI8RD_009905, partial [Bacillariaceae sp.]